MRDLAEQMNKAIRFLAVVFLLFAITLTAGEQFEYGGSLRLRQEYMRNVFDFNSETPNDNFIRIYGSVWGKWNFTDDIAVLLKVTSEPRLFINRDGKAAAGRDICFEEAYIDNLYLDVNNLMEGRLDLRIGRQNFKYGDEMIIASRTGYYNAVKAGMEFDGFSLDAIYVIVPSYDDVLPVINDVRRKWSGADERGLILYGKAKLNDALNIEPYYVYKVEDSHKRQGNDVPRLAFSTIGSRALYDMSPYKLRGELAYQFGEYDGGRNKGGAGANIFVTRAFPEAKFSPVVDAGIIYLSGENTPYSGYDGGWNPVFAKESWLSNGYSWALASERGEWAYWSNLQAYRIKTDMKIADNTGLCLAYNYLRANNTRTGALYGGGKERGHLSQVTLNRKINANMDALVLLEHFIPGSFYAGNDTGLFLRTQLQIKF